MKAESAHVDVVIANCHYCNRPAATDGSIVHRGGCVGLQDVRLNRLQYDALKAKCDELREALANLTDATADTLRSHPETSCCSVTRACVEKARAALREKVSHG